MLFGRALLGVDTVRGGGVGQGVVVGERVRCLRVGGPLGQELQLQLDRDCSECVCSGPMRALLIYTPWRYLLVRCTLLSNYSVKCTSRTKALLDSFTLSLYTPWRYIFWKRPRGPATLHSKVGVSARSCNCNCNSWTLAPPTTHRSRLREAYPPPPTPPYPPPPPVNHRRAKIGS